MYEVKSNTLPVDQGSRQLDVPGQLEAQEKFIAELDEYLARLEERLRPVLRNAGPDSAEKSPAPIQSIVPLASVLRQNNQRIASLSAHINDIFIRLEL